MFRKLGSKLTLAVRLIVLVTISIFSFFNTRSDTRSLLAEVERHADQLSEAVKSGTEYDMLLNQRDRIHETIKRMATGPSLQRIRIMNKLGEVIQRVVEVAGEPVTSQLPTRALIALRFASDEEVPGLVEQIRGGALTTPDAIKRAIRNWRPDYLRA